MVLSISERIWGFLFSPSNTFDASASEEDARGDAYKHSVVILAIFAVVVAIIVGVAFSLTAGIMFGLMGIPFVAAVGAFFGALIAGMMIGVFFGGLWLISLYIPRDEEPV